MGVGARDWGVTRWEQVIIMGQRVRVSHSIGWQGKYVVRDVITKWTSVGGYKAHHRRSIGIIRKSGCGWVTCLCPCPSDSTCLSVRSLPIVMHVICPWAIIYNPNSHSPGLKPPQSPFPQTMWNHFLQCEQNRGLI